LSDKKHDYISTILKVKNQIPGPIYDVCQDDVANKKARFYLSKNKADSFFNELIKEGQKVPGVGKYDPMQPRLKITGNYT